MNISVGNLAALVVAIVFFGVLYYLDRKKHVDFGILTLLGTGFGVLIGVVFRENYEYVVLFGNVYTRVLSALVIPLLLFSIISSVTNLSDSISLKKIGLKSILFLLLNTLIASIITLIAAVALHIGQGFQYEAAEYTAKEVPSVIDTLLSLFPNNIISHWQNGEVIPILTFAIIIAVAYNAYVKDHPEVKAFKAFIDAGNKVLGQAVSWLMGFTPYAVLSLIARAVGRSNVADLLPLFGGTGDCLCTVLHPDFWCRKHFDPTDCKFESNYFPERDCTGSNRGIYFTEQCWNDSCNNPSAERKTWS